MFQSSCMSVPSRRACYGLIQTLLGGTDTVFLPLQREDAPGQTYRDETIKNLYYGLKNGL